MIVYVHWATKLLFPIHTILAIMTDRKDLSIKQFQPISVIGRGAYAKVILARYLSDNCLYAIKILKKQHILESNQ